MGFPSQEDVLKWVRLLHVLKKRKVFLTNYLSESPMCADSKTWTPARHVHDFPRYYLIVSAEAGTVLLHPGAVVWLIVVLIVNHIALHTHSPTNSPKSIPQKFNLSLQQQHLPFKFPTKKQAHQNIS